MERNWDRIYIQHGKKRPTRMFVHSTRRGVFKAMGQTARVQGLGRPGQDWQPGMPITDGQFAVMVETMGEIISHLFSLLGNGVW